MKCSTKILFQGIIFAGCISEFIAASSSWLPGWTCTWKLSLPCLSPTPLRGGGKRKIFCSSAQNRLIVDPGIKWDIFPKSDPRLHRLLHTVLKLWRHLILPSLEQRTQHLHFLLLHCFCLISRVLGRVASSHSRYTEHWCFQFINYTYWCSQCREWIGKTANWKTKVWDFAGTHGWGKHWKSKATLQVPIYREATLSYSKRRWAQVILTAELLEQPQHREAGRATSKTCTTEFASPRDMRRAEFIPCFLLTNRQGLFQVRQQK